MLKIKLNYLPGKKKILILSPHPDDEIIGMGASLILLRNRKNDITFTYMTSGYKGVAGEESIRVKSEIRQSEVKQALRILGYLKPKLIFLNLPFYAKGEVSSSDIEILSAHIKNIMPDVIFTCSDTNDPHKTHKKCLQVFQKVIAKIKFSGEIWFYSGVWKRYNFQKINVAVTFNREIMDKKIEAIKAHKSQEVALYPAKDNEPFWKKAKDYNRLLAKQLVKRIQIPYNEIYPVRKNVLPFRRSKKYIAGLIKKYFSNGVYAEGFRLIN